MKISIITHTDYDDNKNTYIDALLDYDRAITLALKLAREYIQNLDDDEYTVSVQVLPGATIVTVVLGKSGIASYTVTEQDVY